MWSRSVNAKTFARGCSAHYNHASENGRLLIVNLDFDKVRIKLVAAYAPTQNKVREQHTFFSALREEVQAMSDIETAHMLICGDLNVHLTKRDTCKSSFCPTQTSRVVTELMTEYGLTNLWRNAHPETTRYTWKRLSPPIQQSRLDYILGGESLVSNHMVKRSEIKQSI